MCILESCLLRRSVIRYGLALSSVKDPSSSRGRRQHRRGVSASDSQSGGTCASPVQITRWICFSAVSKRPFPSSKDPVPPSTFLAIMNFIWMGIKHPFRVNGYALSLCFKQRFWATRKWRTVYSDTNQLVDCEQSLLWRGGGGVTARKTRAVASPSSVFSHSHGPFRVSCVSLDALRKK